MPTISSSGLFFKKDLLYKNEHIIIIAANLNLHLENMPNIFKKIAGYTNPQPEPETGEEEYVDQENGEEEYEEEGENLPAENAAEPASETEWSQDLEEGQLSIDVFQTPEAIVVKSTIAGVRPEDIDISINNDMLTIRGKRELEEEIREEDYLYKECYWGSFSRSIILPVEVESEKIEAFLENGVLTIILPKAKSAKPIMIKVKGR